MAGVTLCSVFGIGIALCGAALWLALEPRVWSIRVLASSVAALACYFSHIAAFGFYALVIFGVEAVPAAIELRRNDWPAVARRAAVVGPQFIPPTALFLASWQPAARGPISYAGFWRKADLLFSVFDNYDRAFDIACFALFLGLVAWLAATRRLHPVPRLGWAAGIVSAAYLLSPSQMYGGSAADHRLPLAIFLLLLSACAPCLPNRRTAIAVAVAAASVLVARTALIEHVWRRADRIYSADLSGIDMLPRGSKLAVAYPASAVNLVPVPQLHLAVLAIARRDAFVPTLFALPSQQPVVLRPPYAALAEPARPERLWAALVGGDTAGFSSLPAVLEQYDYIAVTDNQPVHIAPNPCLAPVFAQPNFQILAILREPGCTFSRG